MNQTLSALLISLLAANAFAQAGKPTKAQTAEYIEANYRTAFDYHAQEEKQTESLYSLQTAEGAIRDLDVDIDDTRVTVSFHEELSNKVIGAVRVDGEALPLDNEKQIFSRRVSIAFDLKDIESIEGATGSHVYDIAYEHADSNGLFPMYLVFKAAGGKRAITVTADGADKQLSDVWVPYATDAVKENHQALRDLKTGQLYKAFEHLRKLSGAPEPVRF